MLDDLEENRYPWANALEFIGGGYLGDLGALHLVVGGIAMLWIIWRALRASQPLPFCLATLYFSLTVFTNPAYTLAGLNPNEVSGILAVLASSFHARMVLQARPSCVALAIGIVFLLGFAHMMVAQFLYPELTRESGQFVKIAINVKIAVLALNLLILGHGLRQGLDPKPLLQSIVSAGTVGLLAYLLQGGVLASGTAPYGTYLDAGYVGVPSFGSVSIERGHFGKFMAGYYPFFLFALLAWGWRWRFYMLVLVTLINFSSSSQVFFIAFGALALWHFRRFVTARVALTGGIAISTIATGLLMTLWDVFAAVGSKVYDFAISGEEGGGRGVDVFLAYVDAYPLGMGYSGSTLRTAPSLPEINAAAFAFVSQYSLLAVPILLGFAWLIWRALRAARGGALLFQCMAIGVLMSVLIFGADILWFVPMIWLPFELLHCRQLRAYGPERARSARRRAAQPRTAAGFAGLA